ncbi:MAG: hypothetical protein IKC85_07100, partial [Bacteroidaceae bacterium]|nr:hypothetical protein [Bacteroidaceae bacterium]
MKKIKIVASLIAMLLVAGCAQQPRTFTNEEITEAWHKGLTLPVDASKQFPPKPVKPEKDNGLNVLVDVSHQCTFAYLWGMPPQLRADGYRAIPSMASLNTVLDEDGVSRMRLQFDEENNVYPFGWVPNYKYNIILTQQLDRNAPIYTKAECKALENFVADGGSLYILTNAQNSVEGWSMNDLASTFGAKYTDKSDKSNGVYYAVVEVDENWEVVAKGENGQPIRARRNYKDGRVIISGFCEEIKFEEIHDQTSDEEKARKNAINEWRRTIIDESFGWLCENQESFGEKYRPGQSGWGGGGAIYPELETNLDGFVVYYTPNMDEKLKQTVVTEMPRITDQIMAWHPSTPTPEPMYLLLAAGGGGGWAVNAYKPKENGIISTDIEGLIGIYAHELAHTLGGPANAKGEKAGESPFHNQGEAHAGWFQGKIMAMYDSTLLEKGNRNCEALFTPEYLNLDLKRYTNDKAYADSCGHGKDWGKSWIIWQKMDDVYGPTWYPRWRNIQYTRWMETPKKVLTWEETIEDMSIAVGEDLFPFFRALNTSLDRETCGEITFNGEKLTLPVARIDATTPPGKVNLSAIGDWSKPLP